MKKSIVKELEIAINSSEINKTDDKLLNLQKAYDEFKELIDKGITKQRGNNLMPFDEKHLHKSRYNANF